jgi:hypothetical protein
MADDMMDQRIDTDLFRELIGRKIEEKVDLFTEEKLYLHFQNIEDLLYSRWNHVSIPKEILTSFPFMTNYFDF